ncbi:hypothetical protein ABIC33_006468 [Variovorax sp. 1140]|uniref:hypothetical protein n=1 Tax=Variovorax atrisoli TaxID=3394203 RepID=UPI003396313D
MTTYEPVLERAQTLLSEAIEAQRFRLKGYERPSELLALETVRAIDYMYCGGLFPRREQGKRLHPGQKAIMSSGVNDALQRILPTTPNSGPFKPFLSSPATQAKADDFLFDCGLLSLAERQQSFLREGLLQPVIDGRRIEGMKILVLTAADPSLYREAVGWAGLEWDSEQTMLADRSHEEDLENRHRSMLPTLAAQIEAAGSTQSYVTSQTTDRYFHEWAEIYLRRMPYRDLLDPGERIGGRVFSDYVAVIEALSAMAQMRLCYAGLLKHRDRRLDLRNLITGAAPHKELIEAVANFLDAETAEVQHLIGHLMLDRENRNAHLERGDTAWASVIRTSSAMCLLPTYGLDINPFLFLLNDLRWKYEKDWFRAANLREPRWIPDLERLFQAPRWQCTRRGVKLTRGSKTVTDIDFAAYDNETGEVAVVQLKWQQPVAADQRIRRSTGRNLMQEGNRWVADVHDWVAEFGVRELVSRLGFKTARISVSKAFVLARYGAHFSGFAGLDERAIWADWAHFQKVRTANLAASPTAFAYALAAEIGAAKDRAAPESLAFPLPNLAIVVNPTHRPPAADSGGAASK